MLVLFLDLITLGIYAPVWYLLRAGALNLQDTKKQLKIGLLWLFLSLQFFGVILDLERNVILNSFILLTTPLLSAENATIAFVCIFFSTLILSLVIQVVVAMRVRGMLMEMEECRLGRPVYYSIMAVFFFHICYLQYKINRL
ncbi:MAG: DUF4234 domain-containing protein [Deltaproteobacteria bacterium]|nr:DUF4234 domain-containing protein [Deltaproteobacteria bacterium]